MAKAGGKLILTDINELGLAETVSMARKQGGAVLASKALDISDLASVQELADEVHRDFGPMDVLCNIAGIALFAQVEDMEHSHWEKILAVNLWGVIHAVECFVPEMIRARSGHLVNVASLAGLAGLPWHAAYSASKHAVVGLSESLSFDLRKHGIHVTLVCPGAVATPLVESVRILADPALVAKSKPLFLKAAVTPEKVAELTLRAVERNRFLVLTSPDIHALYLLKRQAPRTFRGAMRVMSRAMDKALGKR